MQPIRTAAVALAFMLAGLAAVAAQSDSKSKVAIKQGKDVKVTGCVAPSAGGKDAGYVLTNVADKKGTLPDYILLGKDNDDFEKEVGHRVEIDGLAADRGGKVEIETKTKTDVEHGKDQESHTKSTMKGDMPGMTFLSVKSMRVIAAVCP
jgi:hypothetical protein